MDQPFEKKWINRSKRFKSNAPYFDNDLHRPFRML